MHAEWAIALHPFLLCCCCPQAMVKENRLPFTMNYGRNARIGVLPKRPSNPSDKGANVRWFELPQPLVVFHTVNAWQEGDVIRLFACFFDKVYLHRVQFILEQLSPVCLT